MVPAYERYHFHMEGTMDLFGGPGAPEPTAGVSGSSEETLNLGAWFQRSWTTAANMSGQGAELINGILDRFREADALGYDNNEGDQNEN